MARRLADFLCRLSDRQLAVALVLLALPAFLVNLGTIAFIGDEGIRTLVAFEMHRSGNAIVPTLNGELYFNKPPLYNWMILGMAGLFGEFGEWPSRMTTLLCLAGFALAVAAFTRRHLDARQALIQAAMVLTSGRILLWDSMLGLIDIGFSAVVFVNFMLLYTLGQRQRWTVLWPASYFLFALAFLLKGLPAIVFQAISVAVTLTFFRAWRHQLFSRAHLLGCLAGLLPLLLYYVSYALHVDLRQVFAILLDQSMQRTPTHHSAWETVAHLFTFPVEQLYHFLPWSLLLPLVFHQKFRKMLRENSFIRFCLWMLAANLPVYWISAQVYPRYLLMFVPLFNLIGICILAKADAFRWQAAYRWTFLVLSLVALGTTLLAPIVDARVMTIAGWPVWLALGAAGLGLSSIALYHDHRRTFLWMAFTLLLVRIVFDLVVLPLRAVDYRENSCREDCRRAAAAHAGIPWYIYGDTYPGEVARCYSSLYTGRIIPYVREAKDTTGLYLVDRTMNPAFPGEQVDSLRLENRQVFALMRLWPSLPADRQRPAGE